MSSPRQLPAQTSLRAGLHSYKTSRAMTLLTSPHLPQVFLIDSRALAHLRYAQMFSTEPFIIEIVWFNLYLAVLRLRQHLSPTLGENMCVSHVSVRASWNGNRGRGRAKTDGDRDARSDVKCAACANVTCHLKPPQREAEGLREMNPSDVRVKSTGGGG